MPRRDKGHPPTPRSSCAISVWRAADRTVHYVVDDTHIATGDNSNLLDGRIDRGEGSDSIPAWFEEAAKY